jgi:hypothetical protein
MKELIMLWCFSTWIRESPLLLLLLFDWVNHERTLECGVWNIYQKEFFNQHYSRWQPWKELVDERERKRKLEEKKE